MTRIDAPVKILMSSPHEITELQIEWNSGYPSAFDKLMPHVERELRRIAWNLLTGRQNFFRADMWAARATGHAPCAHLDRAGNIYRREEEMRYYRHTVGRVAHVSCPWGGRGKVEGAFPMDPPQEITDLLLEWNSGNAEALNRLMPYVEKELRRIAKQYMGRENPGHTLQTTALVNEVYLKLIGQKHVRWQNRAHFFALSSQFMRRILVDHAKTQHREKRGAGATHVELSDVAVITPEKSAELIALDEALARLAELDPFESRIVEMRYFGGLTALETAEVLQVSEATVRRHWTLAKAWLQRELRGADK